MGHKERFTNKLNKSIRDAFGAKVVVVVVVVIEVIVAPWMLSHPKLHRFSDYDYDYDYDNDNDKDNDCVCV